MTTETTRVERRPRERRAAMLAVVLVLGGVMLPLAVSASGESPVAPVVPDSEPPTEPTTEPTESSAPETTAPSTSPPSEESAIEPTGTDDTNSPVALWIGVILAAGLLGIATWWMLRRTDDREPPSDPDWPETSDVI